MDRDSDIPKASTVPDASDETNDSRGALADADTVMRHDPTLKWVLSDFVDVGETPPPEDVPSSSLPAASTEESTAPPQTNGEGGQASGDDPLPTPVAGAERYLGVTPSDFLTADPTPPPPTRSASSEIVGAAPAAILPSTTSTESELSADAVELLPSTMDVRIDDRDAQSDTASPSAPKSQNTAVQILLAQKPVVTEPREVDPEAVEYLESAEHREESAAGLQHPQMPPPVPVEASGPATAHRLPDTTASPGPIQEQLPSAADTPKALDEPSPVQATQSSEVLQQGTALARLETGADVPSDEFRAPKMGSEPIPEALARRSLKKRSKPWYEEVFDEDYLRTLPFMTPAQTVREVRFILSSLAPPSRGRVLDIACGYGRHALELAQQGFHMTGLDLSLPLLIRAADQAQKRGLSVDFVHADMREMSFEGQFDAAYCLLSSFGYFDEATNLRVASAVCKALKPGGRFLLDILNRDYIVSDLPSRVWWEGDGCVVLEEVDFNYHTSRVIIRRSVAFGNGRQSEQEISMRAYSLHEVGKLLRQAGLRVLDVSGALATKSRFFGAASRNIIAVCEKPATGP